MLDEYPRFSAKDQKKEYRNHFPLDPPDRGSDDHRFLEKFTEEILVLLQTVNVNEFQAAATAMEPPGDQFKQAVTFPSAGIVVGMFGRNKAALIQTDCGRNVYEFIRDALELLPNVKYVIGVGVCYAFDRSKYKLADILVSKSISDLNNSKFDKAGKLINRGETIRVDNQLKKVFFNNLTLREDYEVTADESRSSEVYAGTIAAFPALIDNKEICQKFQAAIPEVIGGEMEGGELLRIKQQYDNIKGVIVIKGVVDYADGTKTKGWQFTAAMAAVNYTKEKLNACPLYYDAAASGSGKIARMMLSLTKKKIVLSSFMLHRLLVCMKGISHEELRASVYYSFGPQQGCRKIVLSGVLKWTIHSPWPLAT